MKVILNKKELAKILLKVLSNQNPDYDSIAAEYIYHSNYWTYDRLVSPYSKIKRKWTMRKVIYMLNILETVSNTTMDNYISIRARTKHGKLTVIMLFEAESQSDNMYLDSILLSFNTPLLYREIIKSLTRFLY